MGQLSANSDLLLHVSLFWVLEFPFSVLDCPFQVQISLKKQKEKMI